MFYPLLVEAERITNKCLENDLQYSMAEPLRHWSGSRYAGPQEFIDIVY